MCNFIEDYLQNPTLAIVSLRNESCRCSKWSDDVDEELIYTQIASPEFRLYEAMM